MTRRFLSMAATGFAVCLAAAGQTVRIDSDDIGGVVTSRERARKPASG